MPVDPASLSIVLYPAPILRTRCLPVPEVGDEVRAVGTRMIELMNEAKGLGLAAPQVGLPWRMFVCDVPAEEDHAAPGEGLAVVLLGEKQGHLKSQLQLAAHRVALSMPLRMKELRTTLLQHFGPAKPA